jgi:carnitine 3-dehydrogenase
LTAPQILKQASEFYKQLGKNPIVLNKDINVGAKERPS